MQANVNWGCQVAVEGCTDSLAANYDSAANSNSVTWCIPVVTGCMMPTFSAASINYRVSGYKTHELDGGAANFDASATVHDLATCLIERHGCMDSLAVNYDSRATVAATCYSPQPGCLDDASPNFNCTALGADVGNPPVYQVRRGGRLGRGGRQREEGEGERGKGLPGTEKGGRSFNRTCDGELRFGLAWRRGGGRGLQDW